MIRIFYGNKEVLINRYFAMSKGIEPGKRFEAWVDFERIVKAHNRFQIAHNAELRKRRDG